MNKYFFKITALSLIEVLITITVVFILCSVSIYSYQDYKMTAMYNSTLALIEQNKLIISNYYAKHKTCPANNFINQTPSKPSFWGTLKNTGCTISLNAIDNLLILSFKPVLTELGDLQYYCDSIGAQYSVVTNYISSCPSTPPAGTPVS